MLAGQPWSERLLTESYMPGQVIFKEGDPPDALYVILEGKVALVKDTPDSPVVIGYHGADAIIGEVSLLTDLARTTSLLAVEPTTALVIPKHEFETLFREQPSFRNLVVQTTADRLADADERRVRMLAAERDLLEQLESLTAETERLTEATQLRQETMRYMIHELRNPLNLIVMALSAVEEDRAYAEDAMSRRFLAMAWGGVQRMAGLIESLADIEQLELEKTALNLSPVDMRDVVDDVVDTFYGLAEASGVGLMAFHRDGDLPTVTGDAERLRQVLANLVDDGLKLTTSDKPVTIMTWRVGNTVRVAVEDGGPGIPPGRREQIFDRFALGPNGDSRSRGGVGLAYCYSAVKAHGGHIWVEDPADGEGARIVFSLPGTYPAGE
jgi:signal transduction histidine kinase